MAPDQDVYRRVGRGGAGNYYPTNTPKGDPTNVDIEAQKTAPDADQDHEDLSTSVAAPPSSSTSAAQGMVRSGRGGAGNYVDTADLPAAQDQEAIASQTAAALNDSRKNQPVRGGLAGRGGAGNWKSPEEQEAERQRLQEGEDRKEGKLEEVERKVMEAVERELKMPDKVHQGSDKIRSK